MYKINGNGIIRLTDNACIPKDEGNSDYRTYLAWLDVGNTPEPEFSETDIFTKAVSVVAARRYQSEISGIEFSGMLIDTGRDSQNLITGATLASIMNPEYVCNWKTPNGFVELTAPTLALVSNAVRTHVQACFDRERELTETIKNGTYTEEMLEQGWPE